MYKHARPDLFHSDLSADVLLLAGQHTAPGLYREIGTERMIILKQADYLPASCDGRVTCYEWIDELWGKATSGPAETGFLPKYVLKERTETNESR